MSASSVMMNSSLAGQPTIDDIDHVTKNAFSDSLRWLRLILLMSWM
jgi:hypothetical protein